MLKKLNKTIKNNKVLYVSLILGCILSTVFCVNVMAKNNKINVKNLNNNANYDNASDDRDMFYDDFASMRHGMQNLMRNIDRMFYDDFGSVGSPNRRNHRVMKSFNYSPNIDVLKKKDHILIKCELPGMDKDKIDITVKDNILTISGKREVDEKIEEENDGQYMYRSIRSSGSFSKSVGLPDGVKADTIEADYKDGILTINAKYEAPKDDSYKVKIN